MAGIRAREHARFRRRTPVSPVYGSTWSARDHASAGCPDRGSRPHVRTPVNRAPNECRVRTSNEFPDGIPDRGPVLARCDLSDPEEYPIGPYFFIRRGLLLGQHQRDRVASHNPIVPLPSNVVLVAARAIPRAAIPLSPKCVHRTQWAIQGGSALRGSDTAGAAAGAAARMRR
jgi:hypothetical protein